MTRLTFFKSVLAAIGAGQQAPLTYEPSWVDQVKAALPANKCKEGEERCPICGKCQKPEYILLFKSVGTSQEEGQPVLRIDIETYKEGGRICTATGCVYVKQEKK